MGGIFKHARSILYGVLSVAFLFGLRSGDNQEYFYMALPFVLFGAAIYGYMQHQSERGARIGPEKGLFQREPAS